ncbi:LuxR C-terminal-related transcriptional regulator [Microbacterium sp. LS_15]|uniref:helix-turn-helix transcriptional regulator n=1 Tax=Microbacterium sp. LS_15 TaxID=3055790 RepID=UPI0035C0F332
MHDRHSGYAVASDRAFLAGSPTAASAPLRGRDDITSSLIASINRSLTGAPTPALIRGRAGMGKTRLLAEILAFAEEQGWSTLTVTPDVDSGAVPLGALTEAMLRGTPPLVTEVELRPVLGTGEAQYWITRLLTDRVESAATTTGGVVVVVDDLQWLDAASVGILLRSAAALADQPVAWVLTSRSGQFRTAHARVAEYVERTGTVVDLEPVAADAALEIASDLAGAALGPKLEAALERTSHIPLLVVELVRGLQEEALLEAHDGVVDAIGTTVPARFGAASRQRVAHLSDDALTFAQVASLFGRRFRLSDVLTATGATAVTSMPVVRELLGADFLTEDGTTLAFVHDTIREAVEATIPASVRKVMLREVAHLRLAFGEPASAVATAVVEAAEPGDQQSFALIRDAAQQLAASDTSQAADLAAAALHLANNIPALAEASTELLPYLWADGRHTEADNATQALTPYLSPESRARVLLGAARRQTESSFDQAIVTCDEALALGNIERSTRADLLAVRALNCANKADFVELTRTLVLAREVADPDVDHEALATVDATESVYAFNSNRFDDAVALMQAASKRAALAGLDPARWVPEGLWDAFLHNSKGDVTHALELVDEGLRSALASKAVVAEAYWMMVRARVLHDLGRLDEAKLQAESVLSLASELGLGDFANATAGIVLFRIALRTGDTALRQQSEPIVVALASGGGVVRAGQWMLVLRALNDGNVDDAVAHSALARESLHDPIPAMTTPSDFADDLLLMEVAIRSDDDGLAREVITRARARYDRNPDSAYCRAILQAAEGCHARDADLLTEAATTLRQLDRPLILALVLEFVGAAQTNAEPAVSALDEALVIYENAGAHRDVNRVLQSLRHRGVRRRAHSQGDPQMLSPREQQVLERVAAGATTQQIADALFMSPHTVVSHIRHIYAKSGVNSRKALREWHGKRLARSQAQLTRESGSMR